MKIFSQFDLLKNETGLTLVELVVVLVIVGILAVFIATIVSYQADAYNKLVKQTDGLQVARNALQVMLRDFRQIMSADSIFLADQDSIKFDVIDDVFVAYKFSNNHVLRNGDLLLDAVEDVQYTYFDSLGSSLSLPVADPSEIRTIDISLTTNVNGQPFNLSTKVQPRNVF